MSFSGNYHVSDNMGELEVREESLYLSFSYTCARVKEPSRLVIYCGSMSFSVGVPAPEDGYLRLEKRISLSVLRSSGFDRIEEARLVPLSQKPDASGKREAIPTAGSGKDEYISFVSGGKRVFLPVRRS